MAIGTGTAILGSAAIGALGSRGSQSGSAKSTQSTEPWWGQQPYLRDLYSRSQYAADQGSSPFTWQAAQMQADRALDPNNLTSKAQGVVGNTIAGKYLTPDSNPFLKASVQDALGLAKSSMAGQYGGQAGSNLGNSGYQEALARGLGATATNAYANAYGQERQNQMAALGMAPGLDYANIGALHGAGQMHSGATWDPIARYQSAISGNSGQSTTTNTPFFSNPLAGALGGALAGGKLAGMFNQPTSMGYNPFAQYGGQYLGQPDFSGGFYG